jgi:quercetin dioxygenase-like cupin family protein
MKQSEENPAITEKVSEGYERTVFHLNNLMVVVCDFTNGPAKDPDPPHSHPHEQITYVAEGELLFFKNGIASHMKKGDTVVIPSGIPHSIQLLSEKVRLIDSFSPIRQDFLKT